MNLSATSLIQYYIKIYIYILAPNSILIVTATKAWLPYWHWSNNNFIMCLAGSGLQKCSQYCPIRRLITVMDHQYRYWYFKVQQQKNSLSLLLWSKYTHLTLRNAQSSLGDKYVSTVINWSQEGNLRMLFNLSLWLNRAMVGKKALHSNLQVKDKACSYCIMVFILCVLWLSNVFKYNSLYVEVFTFTLCAS